MLTRRQFGSNVLAALALLPLGRQVSASLDRAPGITSFDYASVWKFNADQPCAPFDHNKVTFDHTDTDTQGYWQPTLQAFQVPAGKAGLFVVVGQVQWRTQSPTANGYRFIDMVDASGASSGIFAWPDDKVIVPDSGNPDYTEIRQQVIGVGPLQDGDTLALFAEQDNALGATVSVQAFNTGFSLIRLGKMS